MNPSRGDRRAKRQSQKKEAKDPARRLGARSQQINQTPRPQQFVRESGETACKRQPEGKADSLEAIHIGRLVRHSLHRPFLNDLAV